MNNKWISVEEKRMPDESGTYLCYLEQTDRRNVFHYNSLIHFDAKKIFWWGLDDNEEITHWQPLPPLPSEEDNTLPNLPNSTENLSKIADKDEWLNEVRGNEGLIEKFNSEIINISPQLKDVFVRDGGINPLSKRIATKCVQIAKQYSDSKLSELEKEITRLQEKYDENGYECNPLIKLQRMEQHIDLSLEIYKNIAQRKLKSKES